MRHLGIFVILAVFVTTFTFPNVFSGESAYALNSVQEQTQNLSSESSLGPTQYQPTLQKSNAELNTSNIESSNQVSNLGSTDSFDPEVIPYFQTETIPDSTSPTSITVKNRWDTTLTINVQEEDDASTITTYYISSGTSSVTFTLTPTDPVYLTISPGDVDGFRSWQYVSYFWFSINPFLSASGVSASQAYSFVHIPHMNYFTTDSTGTRAGDYFFSNFFNGIPITSLPEGSFNTSSITTVGRDFFLFFAQSSSLTSLPAGSFNTSSMTSVGDYFFAWFADKSSLTSLPDGSFNTSSMTSVSNSFFTAFSASTSLTSLPYGSFNISSITGYVGSAFFAEFAYSSSLTSLPDGSFNTSSITAVGNDFFNAFAYESSLTSLPAGSFNISSITAVGGNFFTSFGEKSSLTSLPAGSFNISSMTSVSNTFFAWFANSSSLHSLPAGSFNTSNIKTVGDHFFYAFGAGNSLASLPAGSFNTSNITSVGNNFFAWFAHNNSLLAKTNTGISIYNASSSSVIFYYSGGNQNITSKSTFRYYAMDVVLDFDSNGGSVVNPIDGVTGQTFTQPTITPTKSGYVFMKWLNEDGTPYAWTTTATGDLTLTAQWEALPYFQTESIPASTASATTITVQNRWDTTLTIDVQAFDDDETITTYSIVGSTSSIIFSLSPTEDVYLIIRPESIDGFRDWYNPGNNPFIRASGESQSQASSFVHIPEMNYFTTDSTGTQAGDNFFIAFFSSSPATSLPVGSFNTSSITTVGNNFFWNFGMYGSLTSLPAGSFNTSNITGSVGDCFFRGFVESSSISSLPDGSFDTSSITTVGDYFFRYFAQSTSLISLPVGSFNTSNITTVGESFFAYFAQLSSLTSLPVGSFNTSNITTVGDYFFAYFAQSSSLTSLPAGSFNTSNIETNVSHFFEEFAYDAPLARANYGVSIKNVSNSPVTFYWASNTGSQDIDSGDTFCCYAQDDTPTITNISPKTVQNSKATSVIITGSNLDDPTYSFQMTSTRFGDSDLDNTSKTFSQIYPSASILNRTDSSATFIIPETVGWVGPYSIELLDESKEIPSKTFITYQLPLGTASKFTDISKLTPTRQANVKWLARTGVTGGCNTKGTKYCPADPVNRGSMAVFLQLLAGYPAGTSKTSSFADVFAGSSKTVTYVSGSKTTKTKVSALSEKRIAAVNWLALTGITGGSGSAKVNGKIVQTYRPQDPVNRGSMATFMLRFSEDVASTITTDGGTGFADVKIGSGNFTITYKGAKKGEKVAKVTATRATAIRWMYDWGITGGSGTDKKGNLTYRAQDPVNRGSMATFMKNLALHMNFTS